MLSNPVGRIMGTADANINYCLRCPLQGGINLDSSTHQSKA